MKLVLPFVLTLFMGVGALSAQQQSLFTPIAEEAMFLPAAADIYFPLNQYETYDLSVAAIRSQLIDAPAESSSSLRESVVQLSVPMPNGNSRTYRVVKSSVMPPDLQARFPQIRSYRAIDVEDETYQGRFSVSPAGFHGIFDTPEGEVFIDPYAVHQNRYHIAYYTKDVAVDADEIPVLSCGYSPDEEEESPLQGMRPPEEVTPRSPQGEPAFIRKYDLALTCTGEYAQQKGGTVELVLASFVAAVDRANQTFEPEVGVRMQLLPNADELIFLNPFSDPFINADEGEELLDQVQFALVNVVGVPFNAFDLGHVFTSACTDVGGVVGGQTCTSGKTRGVTCHYTNNINAIVRRVMTHEIAHQFGVAHSWHSCPGNQGQRAGDSAYEPGGGSTIMSYAGTCNDQDIQGFEDDYYHGHSIAQFQEFSRETTAAACATLIETSNIEPELTLDYEDGFYIPISTPFELEASATDENGDELYYCWEQLNLDLMITPLGAPVGDVPIFRSYLPTTASNRICPRLPLLLNNQSEDVEMLPTYSRAMTFRCSVRDYNPEVGATVFDDVAFRATASAGPFRVLSPNAGDELWQEGDLREVIWDVANTNNAVVDCQAVDIRLSIDGGLTYPITLMSGTPNIGSAFVTIPEGASTDEARIRVEASDNIFFDISNTNFSIAEAVEPAYTLQLAPVFQEICLPGTAEVEIVSGSILDYDDAIQLNLISELPQNVVATFGEESLQPGESTSILLDYSDAIDLHGIYELIVEVIAAEQDTTYRSIYLDIVDNDFSDLTLQLPVEGQTGIELITDFAWTELPNADFYDWQISTSPSFDELIDEAYLITETEITPSVLFEENTLFYWRVRPNNACGPGAWSAPKVFHTVNDVCAEQIPGDTPISIPGQGPLPTITSEIFVPFEGSVSEINLPFISVAYQPIQNFQISLISPSGTEVILYDQVCFGTDLVYIGFDDEAPSAIICPPDDGIVFQPSEPLSTFIGESSLGIWTIKVKVLETGFGVPGVLNDWEIEFCAAGNPQAPLLITNEPLLVPPAASNPITQNLLEVTDGEQGPDQLTYTLVSGPQNGSLYLVDQLMGEGDQYRQSSINATNVFYQHDGSATETDAFTFVVEDGTGGFLPIQTFDIIIDENAVVSTDDLLDQDRFSLYPNPTSDWVRLLVPEAVATNAPVRIFNVQGQLIRELNLVKGSRELFFDLAQQPAGLYFVQYGRATERLLIQR